MIVQFRTSTVMFKGYSGDTLNVVAQLQMILLVYIINISYIVLIRKDAPHNLLIGLVLQPALGYMLTVRKSRNQEAGLLGNHKSDTLQIQNGAVKESSKPQESDTVMVKVLTVTKVPAGFRE